MVYQINLLRTDCKMDETKQDFENRKDEVENYFEFVAIFDDDDTRLQYRKDGEVKIENIQLQFQNILIANAFLVLYNLIESTIRSSTTLLIISVLIYRLMVEIW